MKTEPIVPARIEFDGETPFAPAFGDVYHSRAGALEQAGHVFLAGNGLPGRWQGRARFVVLETGFGLGNNFLATWAAWRADPQRCERLVFISVEKHPPTRADLQRAHGATPLPHLVSELVTAWPPLTPNLHRLAFDDERVVLLLALGDVGQWLREIVAEVDAFFLDGFAPAKNPAMWDARVIKALGRLAAQGATAATWSVARPVRDGLCAAGFTVERASGFGTKRDMTVARYAPSFASRRPPARSARRAGADALVIGAGLAGAAAAGALAREGVDVLVLDAQQQAAQGSSGNPAGLFHGTVHGDDGPHARFNRAAALMARQAYHPLVSQGVVAGGCEGLLRLDDGSPKTWLPGEFVRPLSAFDAAARCDWPLQRPAWFYPGGGWVSPGAVVRHWLRHARVRFRGGVRVQALRAVGERWQALDGQGAVVAEADHVVIANAHDAARLLGDPMWPLESTRGQLSCVPAGVLRPPRVPVAGDGYAIGLPDGSLLCGATVARDDPDAGLRASDHLHNLERLARLAGSQPEVNLQALQGRVGWRLSAADRLPLVGAVPDETAQGARMEQPRFVPRLPGLFVFTALGSRGLTWAPLGGLVLAAWATGAPFALEASLIDAMDPGRFVSRRVRTPLS